MGRETEENLPSKSQKTVFGWYTTTPEPRDWVGPEAEILHVRIEKVIYVFIHLIYTCPL